MSKVHLISCLLLTCSKPKNARVKRALDKREPQEVEGEKTAIFVRGNSTSERVRIAMKELVSSYLVVTMEVLLTSSTR